MPRRTVIVLAALLMAVAGCQTMTGLPARRWVGDRAITAKVKAHLLAARTHAFTRINVDTYDGTVYLSGAVDSEQMKRQVEAIARHVDGVHLVVADLEVRPRHTNDRNAVSGVTHDTDAAAAPVTDPAATPATDPVMSGTAVTPPSSLLGVFPGIARIEGNAVRHPHGPFLAYDRSGHVVGTVYTISMRELATTGLDDLGAGGRPIDHVSIYAVAAHPDVPDPHYHVVLWHVSDAAAASLR